MPGASPSAAPRASTATASSPPQPAETDTSFDWGDHWQFDEAADDRELADAMPAPHRAEVQHWAANEITADPICEQPRAQAPNETVGQQHKVLLLLLGSVAADIPHPGGHTAAAGLDLDLTVDALSDSDLLADDSDYLAQVYTAEAHQHCLCYAIYCPEISASLPAGLEQVTRDRRSSVKHCILSLCASLSGWRFIFCQEADSPGPWRGPSGEALQHSKRKEWCTFDVAGVAVTGRGLHDMDTGIFDVEGISGDLRNRVKLIVSVLLVNDLEQSFFVPVSSAGVYTDVNVVSSGPVRRHISRGMTPWSKAELRKFEDDKAWAGSRNPASLHEHWPELWDTMEQVSTVLLKLRDQHSALRDLVKCFGKSPQRDLPHVDVVTEARQAVGAALGLSPEVTDAHRWCSPWRFNIVAEVQRRSEDRDTAIVDWLREGAPMGIARRVTPGSGCLPWSEAPASMPASAVLSQKPRRNHPSFRDKQNLSAPPGHAINAGHVNAGFGMLFKDQAAAEKFMQSPVIPAPMGCISKVKPDGVRKDRVILDLKANCVNLAAATHERQVLPTVYDHGKDLSELARLRAERQLEQLEVQTMVLDLKDAFMGIPLHPAELPFNCCCSDLLIDRLCPGGRSVHSSR